MTGTDREGRAEPGAHGLPGTARPSRPLRPDPGATDVLGAVWVHGVVTRTGVGPCHGLVTDGGRELALYTRAEVGLVEGERARVLVAPAAFRLDCGPGELMRLMAVDSQPSDDGGGSTDSARTAPSVD